MDTQKFLDSYSAFRNGTDAFHFIRLYPKLNYSDGVQECAEAGCYWLLDIIGTEGILAYKAHADTLDSMGFITVLVRDEAAEIRLVRDSDEPALWSRHIEYTDLPDGEWTFYMTSEDGVYKLFLPTEY